ncbi:MAG: RNA 3'-terminal phosphate cyclase [Dehalococcoidia bacterium]|nr:RNA 3'-terminal phosphate cyclase [Dehalococcoidia bacterium]
MLGVRLSAGELTFAVSAAASGKLTGAGDVNQGAVRRATTMVRIDGSRFSGSGTIVRQAVALSALTGRSVHITNIRFRRPNPGLRPQHARAVEAIASVVGATIHGNTVGSGQLTFEPGTAVPAQTYVWDIGSAGSTVLLAQAVLPVLAFSGTPSAVELRGGLFQDFAPSFYHFHYVLLPLLRRMGIEAKAQMIRPGYVPSGGGILRLAVQPAVDPLRPLVLEERGEIERVWGVALSSHLRERNVSERMARTARESLTAAGYASDFELVDDDSAVQAGASLSVFADSVTGVRLGADRAGAPRRSSEAIGRYAVQHLLEDLRLGATLDRHVADQIIIFGALAAGESRFRIPSVTEHVETGAWLAREFLGADVTIDDRDLMISGAGLGPRQRGK